MAAQTGVRQIEARLGTRYTTHHEARPDLFNKVEVFYKRSRRHSTLS